MKSQDIQVRPAYLWSIYILTALFVGFMILVSLRNSTGISILHKEGIELKTLVLYTTLWFLFPLAALLTLTQRLKISIKYFNYIGFPVFLVLLISANIQMTDHGALAGDGIVNKAFIDGLEQNPQYTFLEYYYGSCRPPTVELNDEQLQNWIEKYGRKEWTDKYWTKDINANVRAALTPPFYFILLFGFKNLAVIVTPDWYDYFGAFFGIAALLLLINLLRRWLDEISASMIILGFLLYSPTSFYSGLLYNDSPSFFLFILSIWFYFRKGNIHWLWIFSSGIVMGLAIFTRLTILPFGIMIGVLMLVHSNKRWKNALFFAAGACTIFVIWLLLDYDPLIQVFVNRHFVAMSTIAKSVSNPLYFALKLNFVLFTGLGFGWILLILWGLREQRMKTENRLLSFFANWWFLLFFLVIDLYLGWSEPQRNLIPLIPLIMVMGLRSPGRILQHSMITATIISQVVVNYVRILL